MNYEPADKAVPVLVKLADKYDGKDRWYLEALGIGALGKEKEFLEAWDKGHSNKDETAGRMIQWRMKKEAPLKADGTIGDATASGKQASAGNGIRSDGKTGATEGAARPF